MSEIKILLRFFKNKYRGCEDFLVSDRYFALKRKKQTNNLRKCIFSLPCIYRMKNDH